MKAEDIEQIQDAVEELYYFEFVAGTEIWCSVSVFMHLCETVFVFVSLFGFSIGHRLLKYMSNIKRWYS